MKAQGLVFFVWGCAAWAAACDDSGTAAPADTRVDTVEADSSAADSVAADTGIAPEDTAEASDASDSATAPDSVEVPDTTVEDTGVADTGVPDTSVAEGVRHTFAIEPIDVNPGDERQVCKIINIPAGEALDIVRFESRMRGISHHFILYKVIDDSALEPASPSEATTHDCSPASAQLSGDAAYIYGSATPDRVMQTPPGVAFHLVPGQRLILEYHAINYTLEPIVASVEVDLIGAAPDAVVEHHAEIMWFANWGFALPPGRETSDSALCNVPYDVEVFGLMSHFHELGTHFAVDVVRDGESELVYEDDDYAHPKFQPFDPPFSLATGEGLRWTCTWNNTRETWTFPNQGSKDEMCMVFAAVYPKNSLSAEPISCDVLF